MHSEIRHGPEKKIFCPVMNNDEDTKSQAKKKVHAWVSAMMQVRKDYKGKIFFVSVLSCLKQVVSTNVHAPVSSNTIHSMTKWLWLTSYKLSAGAVAKTLASKVF